MTNKLPHHESPLPGEAEDEVRGHGHGDGLGEAGREGETEDGEGQAAQRGGVQTAACAQQDHRQCNAPEQVHV